MIVLAGLVLAVGLGDLVSSLSGRPESRTRAVAGAVVGSAAAILLFVLADIGWDRVAAGSILIALTATFWQGARCMDGAWTPRGALPTLAALVVPLALAIAASAWFPAAQGTVARVVQRLPYAVVGVDPDHLLMVLAFLLLMGSTGNAVVRLALAGVGTPVAVGEARLRGGRLIGPLERVLIFGLALWGAADRRGPRDLRQGTAQVPRAERSTRKVRRCFRLGISEDRRGDRVPARGFAHELDRRPGTPAPARMRLDPGRRAPSSSSLRQR